MTLRVVRVGGSLLTLSDLSARWETWWARQPKATTVAFAGGGPWVELMRQAARRFDIPEAEAHSICVEQLSVTARLLHQLIPERSIWCDDFATLTEMIRATDDKPMDDTPIVFDVRAFLSHRAADAFELPLSWDVTSDSIAACLARGIAADELVIMKSKNPPNSAFERDWRTLAEIGYVDRFFPQVVGDIPRVHFVNMRGAGGTF